MSWSEFLEASRDPARRLAAAFDSPAKSQANLLLSITRANATCEYGQTYDFESISTVGEFRKRVPVITYDHIAPSIERMGRGEGKILTSAPIVAFEKTGGSNSGGKLIPYSRASIEAFRESILAWFHDLLTAVPSIPQGRAYFAISPATRARETTAAGIPIGLVSDGFYFGNSLVSAFQNISVTPPEVALIEDVREWEVATAAYLAAASDLTLVSVWSPSFFSRIISVMLERPSEVSGRIQWGLTGLDGNLERARDFERSIRDDRLDTVKLWPKIALVSAWKDGSSKRMADKLACEVPHAHFQGKGLLATEGIFTIPLWSELWPVPALTSAFLEFADSDGNIRLVHELTEGSEYHVIATTRGGLYRYDIGDIVECMTVHASGLPLLRFVGRGGSVTDLVGEKLNDFFVTDCLQIVPVYSALVPLDNGHARYLIVLESSDLHDFSDLIGAVDKQLLRNPQYAYARKLGQLQPPSAIAVPHAARRFVDHQLRKGKKLGDIKPPSLIKDISVASEFWPETVATGEGMKLRFRENQSGLTIPKGGSS